MAANFAQRYDVFLKDNPELLKSKLNTLLQHGVDPTSILRCKATFKCDENQIKNLIRRLKDGGVDHILSYMISNYHSKR